MPQARLNIILSNFVFIPLSFPNFRDNISGGALRFIYILTPAHHGLPDMAQATPFANGIDAKYVCHRSTTAWSVATFLNAANAARASSGCFVAR